MFVQPPATIDLLTNVMGQDPAMPGTRVNLLSLRVADLFKEERSVRELLEKQVDRATDWVVFLQGPYTHGLYSSAMYQVEGPLAGNQMKILEGVLDRRHGKLPFEKDKMGRDFLFGTDLKAYRRSGIWARIQRIVACFFGVSFDKARVAAKLEEAAAKIRARYQPKPGSSVFTEGEKCDLRSIQALLKRLQGG